MTHQEDSQYGVAPVENFARASTVGATTMVSIERGHYPTFYQLLAHALLHGRSPPVDAREALNVLQLIEQLHRQHRVRIA